MKLKSLYIEIYYGEYSEVDVIGKITNFFEKSYNIHEDFFLLLSRNDCNYESIILFLINKNDSNFSHSCTEAEILAAKFFLKVLYSYQNGDIETLKLFKIFSALEAGFVSIPRHLYRNINYYPIWMNKLYHAYDSYDKNWTIENTPHLSNAIENQIDIINIWLKNYNFSA